MPTSKHCPTKSLIIISGHPGTGKSTFAKSLSAELLIPSFSKDSFKETIANSFLTHSRELSNQVGKASIALLYSIAKTTLENGKNLILEANFDPNFAAADLINTFETQINVSFLNDMSVQTQNPRLLEINFRCSAETALRRFQTRENLGLRHTVHIGGTQLLNELRERILIDPFACIFPEQVSSPQKINGILVEAWPVDTTECDFSSITKTLISNTKSWFND